MKVDIAHIEAYAQQHGLNEQQVLRIAVSEAFIRRAAMVASPFILKGSYATRQSISQCWKRIPGDLDWVSPFKLDKNVLNQWATRVTEVQLDDGVQFRSFTENAFWRMIDYAMDEDFPTVNTDLLAWVGDREFEMQSMDVSFGLNFHLPPQPLTYSPTFGDAFVLPQACPIDIQVAWKLHQCLICPRFKDMLDLILILREITINVDPVLATLRDECRGDANLLRTFNRLLDGSIAQHPDWNVKSRGKSTAEQMYAGWRESTLKKFVGHFYETMLALVYADKSATPEHFSDFVAELARLLKQAGFVPL